MEREFIYIGAVLIGLLTLIMGLFLLYINYKKTERIKEQLNRAELSYMREYYEKMLYDINNKISEDSNRWKEINHLLLSYKPEVNNPYYFNNTKTFDSIFFKNFGIDVDNIITNKEQVFILTPFLNAEKDTFHTIQKACNSIGFRAIKGDEEYIKGDVFSYILQNILKSRIVIANINGRNPNVFYELGIAQAIGKPTILVSENLNEIPFDLQSQNIILYKTHDELFDKLSSMLKKSLIHNL